MHVPKVSVNRGVNVSLGRRLRVRLCVPMRVSMLHSRCSRFRKKRLRLLREPLRTPF